MDDRHGERDLQRLKWIAVILPVAFIWLFEALRLTFIEQNYGQDSHVISALLMAVAVTLFALVLWHFIDRAEERIVGHNKDLTLTHAVTSAVRGGLGLEAALGAALERMLAQTDALAGVIRVTGIDGEVLAVRRPGSLASGLEWVGPLLDEPSATVPVLEPTYSKRSGLDTLVLDVPLARGAATLGSVRLVFHPPVSPDVSTSALVDVGGEIATSVELNRVVADLRRRERERAAMNEVAIQLTGRADLREVLDTINRHARELLGADRAIVCLADAREPRSDSDGWAERLALVDDGSICVLAHEAGSSEHPRNPLCPLAARTPGAEWMARPLRSPDGILGELCVVRETGGTFRPTERALLAALADLAAVAVRTARLRDAEQQWTILAERDRIARELHDSMAQVLGVIHLRLRTLETSARGDSRGLAADLGELADLADEAYRDVREAILGLRETIPSDGGLEGALREYLRKFSRQTGIQASLVCEGDASVALPPRSEVQLLRVVQEALTNVRKHSRAHRATVTLDRRGRPPLLVVEDDGVGFEPGRLAASFEGGFGLASMRERVEGIGGALDVHTAPGQGTRIVVRLEAEAPGDPGDASTAPAASAAGR